jgi:hypothetical protein
MYSPSGPQACSAVFGTPFAPAGPENPGHGQAAIGDVLDFGSVGKLSTLLFKFTDMVVLDFPADFKFRRHGRGV